MIYLQERAEDIFVQVNHQGLHRLNSGISKNPLWREEMRSRTRGKDYQRVTSAQKYRHTSHKRRPDQQEKTYTTRRKTPSPARNYYQLKSNYILPFNTNVK
jgi:hypothetical protein